MMIYLLIIILFIIDIILHIKVYSKKENLQQTQEMKEYTCFICQEKFMSADDFRPTRAICSDECKNEFLKVGFK